MSDSLTVAIIFTCVAVEAHFKILRFGDQNDDCVVMHGHSVDAKLANWPMTAASRPSLRVTLRAEPSYFAIAAHPIVNIGFVF